MNDLSEISQVQIDASLSTIDSYFEDLSFIHQYLTDREFLVIKKIILQDESISDIADDLRISRQAVNKTKLRAIKKLQKIFEEK
jgi:predicted DNA-binding protein YlxM (UPF0122 family)